MRRILVENARRKKRLKQDESPERMGLDEADMVLDQQVDDLLALDDALAKLTREDPVKARLVQLRYFAGLTKEQAAQAMNISRTTATRSVSSNTTIGSRIVPEPTGPSRASLLILRLTVLWRSRQTWFREKGVHAVDRWTTLRLTIRRFPPVSVRLGRQYAHQVLIHLYVVCAGDPGNVHSEQGPQFAQGAVKLSLVG